MFICPFHKSDTSWQLRLQSLEFIAFSEPRKASSWTKKRPSRNSTGPFGKKFQVGGLSGNQLLGQVFAKS
ncbi:MAG: hypothetical protein ABF380_04175, partial [Akkermansiaceae bacterium]